MQLETKASRWDSIVNFGVSTGALEAAGAALAMTDAEAAGWSAVSCVAGPELEAPPHATKTPNVAARKRDEPVADRITERLELIFMPRN